VTRAAVLATAVIVSACGSSPDPDAAALSGTAAGSRRDALQSAHVWQRPAVPIERADLSRNPPGPGALKESDDVSCRFTLKNSDGKTPKFYCTLENGDVVKVKYGASNGELYAEVAGSRLLSALGFATDRMYVVHSVRCAGCPLFPFESLKCFSTTGLAKPCVGGTLDYTRVIQVEPAVIERPYDGRKIEGPDGEGWAWFELDSIDEARGGSSRREVDAFRLLAIALAHWDNKAANQRLVCPPGADRGDGGCARPIAMIHDLGATFGPDRVDLANWRRTPMWADAKACAVSMHQLPFGGATFPDTRISEEGRQFFLSLAGRLTEEQLRDLFTGARIPYYDQLSGEGQDVSAWVNAFLDKVRQVREAGPCPER
jgi:hypothetical protein